MWSSNVEVSEAVLLEHALHVALAEENDVVKALAPHATEEALADRVHQRRSNRAPDDTRSGSSRNVIKLGA
jgi:hypothetical protein